MASNPPRIATPFERAPDSQGRSPAPRIDLWFARQSSALASRPGLAIALSLLLVLAVGISDYLTVARISVLYVMPVAVATWTCGRAWGATTSMLSVAVWGLVFRAQSYPQSDPYFVWDCAALGVTLLLFGELLARLRVALARSDDRFVRVLSGLHAAVFVSDEHQVLFANEWLARMLDRSHAPGPDDIAARFPIAVTGTAALAETPAHLPFTGYEVRDAIDGRWYLAQAGAITWTDGRRVRLTVLTDISEQKRAAALQRENQAALHHTARLVNLAEAGTTLAHELNQPLVAIVGYNSACSAHARQRQRRSRRACCRDGKVPRAGRARGRHPSPHPRAHAQAFADARPVRLQRDGEQGARLGARRARARRRARHARARSRASDGASRSPSSWSRSC